MGGGGFSNYGMQQRPWDRVNTQQIPGGTQSNPTARPGFQGQGFFNQMAYQQSPFGGGGQPYGNLYQQPMYPQQQQFGGWGMSGYGRPNPFMQGGRC